MGGITPPVKHTTGSGDIVYLRKMSGIGRAQYYETIEESKDFSASIASARITAALVIMTLVDKDCNHVYANDDLEKVMNLDSDFTDSIAEKSLDVNGLSDKAAKKAKKK